MKQYGFEIGDMISSICGDYGVVLSVGPRPDNHGNGKIGVYALWAREQLAFWMHIDEPTIQLYTESNKGGKV